MTPFERHVASLLDANGPDPNRKLLYSLNKRIADQRPDFLADGFSDVLMETRQRHAFGTDIKDANFDEMVSNIIGGIDQWWTFYRQSCLVRPYLLVTGSVVVDPYDFEPRYFLGLL